MAVAVAVPDQVVVVLAVVAPDQVAVGMAAPLVVARVAMVVHPDCRGHS